MSLFTQSFSATLTTVGAITKKAKKRLPATISSTGSFVKLTVRSLVAAGITSSATFTAVKAKAFVALTAGITFSGSFSKQTGKSLSAAITSASTFGRRFPVNLSAAISSSGAFSRMLGKNFTAGITSVGVIASQWTQFVLTTSSRLSFPLARLSRIRPSAFSFGGIVFGGKFVAVTLTSPTQLYAMSRKTDITLHEQFNIVVKTRS